MAPPIALAAIGAQAVGSVIQGVGSAYQGSAQANMYKYQAGVATLNQKVALQNADYAREVGEVQAQESGMKTAFQVGQTKATQAGSGLDVNVGSSARIRESEEELGAYDQSLIRSDAAKRAYGYEVEAATDAAQAGAYNASAKTSKTAGMIGMFSSILGGASSVGSKWLQGSQMGLFGA